MAEQTGTATTPIGRVALLGVVVASLGGPLALAAQAAPAAVADTSASAGLATVAAAAAFAVPLVVWLRYAREVPGPGGLYGFVVAGAGPRAGLVHAVLWVASYLLYLAYTTASIVYDTLPVVLPGVRPYRPALELAIPVLLAAVMLAGRAVALAVIGALAAAQLLLVAGLAAVTLGHDAPASAFAAHAPTGALAGAAAQTSLLYVCGSLPLYLGGELATPGRTLPRTLTAGVLLTAAGVTATVFPLAADPAFTRAPIPGMSVAQVFAGHSFAVAVGIGVAASAAGLILVEYLALGRLLHALTHRPVRAVSAALAVVLVAAAPISLVDPDRFYGDLIRPSLIALWLSQIIVFAAYPRFAARHHHRALPAWTLAAGGTAFAVYGFYAAVRQTGT